MRATDTMPTLPSSKAPGRQWIALLLSLLVVAASFAPAVLAPSVASADPGNEWSDDTSRVFLSQGDVFADATQLHVGEQNPDGSFNFTNLGTDGVTYNATAYNPGDGHIYGVVMTSEPGGGNNTADRGDIVVIGDGHTVDSIIDANLSLEDSGPNPVFFVGAISPDTNLMYVTQGSTSEADTFLVVDPTTGAVVSEVTFSGSMAIADWTFADGYLWGLGDVDLYRIDPGTGDITSSTIPLEPGDGGTFGGAWTFGNGNLGFSNNDTGNVYQLDVLDPTSPGWTAEVVAVVGGPGGVGFNDATYIAAPPVDLEVIKTAPASYEPETSYDYTLTVINNGPGQSSGWTVADTIPDGLTIDGVTNDAGANCPVDGQVITCSGGQLDVGNTVTITITVTPESDAPECLTNTASVLGNEDDPDESNDEASATSCATGVTVDKSVDPASGTAVEAGDTLDYTLTFSNDSEFVSSPVAYDDYLGELIDDAVITTPPASSSTNLTVSPVTDGRYSVTGELDPSEVATVTYTVEVLPQADRGDHFLGNFVTEPGDTPPPGDPDEVCEDWDLPCTSNPVEELVVTKSVDPVDGSVVEAGDELTYTLTFESVGAAPADVNHDDVVSGVVDDAMVVQDPGPGVGDLSVSAIDSGRFTVSGVVPAGDVYTVTYAVQVLPDEQRGDDVLGNFVVEEGEDPPPDCEQGDPLCTSNPVEELVVTTPMDPLPVTGAGALRLLLTGLAMALVGGGLVRVASSRRLHTVAGTRRE